MDAINSPEHKQWNTAIDKEMNNLVEHQAYELVPTTDAPHNHRIIGSQARLLAQGDVDCRTSWAPVGRISSILVVPAHRVRA